MPFPESKRVLFTNNPLAEVICQLKFPTILSISTKEPDKFQELIRNDYPVFNREVNEGIPHEIATILNQVGGIPSIKGSINYKFTTYDGFRCASLSQDFIALKEQKYSKWDDFYCELQKLRTTLEQIYKPSFYSRIGLRYVDLIDKREIRYKRNVME